MCGAMYRETLDRGGKIIAVAPMMDWTDRHCRFFHRQLSRSALLYTEMVVADAIIHGDRARLLGFDASEHPVALQVGGSEPDKLATAACIGEEAGYDEINLNVGCPSDRVQSGAFGACLMEKPQLVAECVSAMKAATSLPVTVKCRLGVDEQDPEIALDQMAEAVFAAGADALWVHARKAWLKGLSPKENRDIPPLDYDRVRRLKARWPGRFIGINGGIVSLETAEELLDSLDGVMLGRAAYHNPTILAGADALAGEGPSAEPDYDGVISAMAGHASGHIEQGGRLVHVTRHMTGLFHGFAGARRYRQILATEACRPGAGPDVLLQAYAAVDLSAAPKAA